VIKIAPTDRASRKELEIENHQSIRAILVKVLASIFVIETIAMFLFSVLLPSEIDPRIEALLDAILLCLGFLPLLSYWIIQPWLHGTKATHSMLF